MQKYRYHNIAKCRTVDGIFSLLKQSSVRSSLDSVVNALDLIKATLFDADSTGKNIQTAKMLQKKSSLISWVYCRSNQTEDWMTLK